MMYVFWTQPAIDRGFTSSSKTPDSLTLSPSQGGNLHVAYKGGRALAGSIGVVKESYVNGPSTETSLSGFDRGYPRFVDVAKPYEVA